MTAMPVAAAASAPASPLLTAPILPMLLRFAAPNMGGMLAGSVAAIAETAYVGSFGIAALAGMAVVFPTIMLQGMLSAGAMGGGISSAVARALGAGDQARADAIAFHSVLIGLAAGVTTTLVMLAAAPAIYTILGGRGEALDEGVRFARIAFLGATGAWLLNLLSAVARGAGNMAVPSVILLAAAVLQVAIGGALGLGWGPLPRLGMAGVAAGQVVAGTIGAVVLWRYLASGRARVRLAVMRPSWAVMRDILKIGGPACLSPLQTIATVLILTRIVAGQGPAALAGYGIGTRLEFLLVPIAFAIGVASVPIVGVAIGAGDVVRARRTAWTAGALAAALLGGIGIMLAVWPMLWIGMFTSDAAIAAAAAGYFRWAGPTYVFYGVGLSLYFSSMAAGRIRGVLLAGTSRLGIVAIGWLVFSVVPPSPGMVFALVALAMTGYGLASIAAVRWADWRPQSH